MRPAAAAARRSGVGRSGRATLSTIAGSRSRSRAGSGARCPVPRESRRWSSSMRTSRPGPSATRGCARRRGRSAGRDRVFGAGRTLDRRGPGAAERLLALVGAVVFEPWLERIGDVAVCGVSASDVSRRAAARAAHRAARRVPRHRPRRRPLDAAEHDQLDRRRRARRRSAPRAGYRGPFGVDAFVYREGDERRLHPLCEINARYTFGHVARALGTRFGVDSARVRQVGPARAHGACPSERVIASFATGVTRGIESPARCSRPPLP